MFKKTSRTKNIRRKVETTDDEPTEIFIEKTVTSSKKKIKSKKALNALSFAQDDEGGDGQEFQIKKNRNLHLKLPELQDEADEKQQSNYDKEALEKLRASTPSLPASVKSNINDVNALLHEKFPSTVNAKIEGVDIPDASAIMAAKKKREQMRKGFNITESDDGFIPLENSNDDEEDRTGSRLVREEDDIADDGEAEFEKYVGDKITLSKSNAKKQEIERREGVREMIEEAEDDDNQSEDMERWEEDMMKFGGAKTQSKDFDPYSQPPNYRPAQVPEISALPTLTDVMKYLDLSTTQVADSMQHYESNLEESLKAIENSAAVDQDLKREIERGSERYNYFLELAQYVNDLGEFLDAKFPGLEKLESQAHDIISTKTEITTSRRWQNNLDDLCQFMNITANQSDEVMTDQSEQVDEFGRIKAMRNSVSARQRRKLERQQRIEKQAGLSDLEGEDAIKEQGLWTDDEMNEEYYEQKDTKLQQIQINGIDDLLADVSDEYRSLGTVKNKFEAWKLDYYDDYQKAYGSLSLPGAFEFYIRAELVSWDPFSDPLDFDSMQWHKILSEYGVSAEHEDPDVEMLNKVVEKTIINKIKTMLDTLDGASSKQMRYAAQVIEQVSYYVDTNEKAYRDLALGVYNTLEKQISQFVETIETAVPKSHLDPESTQAKHRFFWTQFKYLKTLLVWRRHLPKDQLDRLGSIILDRIISPILKPESYPADLHLQNEALLLLTHLQK
ncbi:hypothetical protein [Parasitella parasitica]|uniref:GCF C-terminal domain-containing protein n=1 Tax=Parasitella parasitica TaxID=35722 RepID=A0A0B7MYL2_9FUNG|nr:hypothetical protein [Parasitella parasitica]